MQEVDILELVSPVSQENIASLHLLDTSFLIQLNIAWDLSAYSITPEVHIKLMVPK